ncbi:SOS response-associated peptidase [Peribacillus sp. SCS-155]|uniref:SOS response-associated peptidase n=1 Tax=Peribacillus sedimenti TaxID=3115297 RepID=UPI0039065C60
MCGRYNLFSELQTIAERFDCINREQLELIPRYNIAPGQDILAIKSEGGSKEAALMRWGLIPGWANDPKIGYKMINARAESVDEKPTFKGLIKSNRCIIIADGFYEWKRDGERKQPYHIQLKDKEPFAFAGLYSKWNSGGKAIYTCTIITTEANELMEGIHHRMPVILNREDEETWLDNHELDHNQLQKLLVPFESSEMMSYPISTIVNNARNEGKEIINSL